MVLQNFQKILRRTLIASNLEKSSATSLYITNLPKDIQAHKIRDLFSKKVPVHFVNVPKEKNGEHLGYCFAQLDEQCVDWFIKKFHGLEISGKRLYVEKANNKPRIPIGKQYTPGR